MNINRDIDTFQLKCFLALAEHKSFTKAADILGRTQSAISQQIKKLEDVLEVELFNRDSRNVGLTLAGEKLVSPAKMLIDAKNKMFSAISSSEYEGEVRLGVPEDFASVYLTKTLAKFKEHHPHSQLSVDCDLTMNLINKFKKDELDIIFFKQVGSEFKSEGSIVWQEHLEWVGNNKTKLGKDGNINLVLSPNPCIYRKRALEALDSKMLAWHINYSSESYASKIAAVEAGLGITVLPTKMVPKSLNIIKDKKLPDLKNTQMLLAFKPYLNKAGEMLKDSLIETLRE